MTTPTPSTTSTPTQQTILTPDQRLALEQKERYDRITRNLAIGGVIACPIIALLPPRKLDLYTLSLGIGFYLSADHLAQQYNGRPLVQQISWSVPGVNSLPTEKAEELSKRLKEQQRAERIRREGMEGVKKDAENRSLLTKVWMGDETEGWKERRMEEERKALEEGKSYTDMIFEQIWEVWNWDKKGKEGKDGENAGKKE